MPAGLKFRVTIPLPWNLIYCMRVNNEPRVAHIVLKQKNARYIAVTSKYTPSTLYVHRALNLHSEVHRALQATAGPLQLQGNVAQLVRRMSTNPGVGGSNLFGSQMFFFNFFFLFTAFSERSERWAMPSYRQLIYRLARSARRLYEWKGLIWISYIV